MLRTLTDVAIRLHLRKWDVPGDLRIEYQGELYELPALPARSAEMLAVLIARAHDAEYPLGDDDDPGWVNEDNYAEVVGTLFGVLSDPRDGRPSRLKDMAYEVRRALAEAVFGSYDGAGRRWAHRLLVRTGSRGYRLAVPASSLRLTITHPARRIPEPLPGA